MITQDYYIMELITAVKSFMMQAPGIGFYLIGLYSMGQVQA
jgi:hypothetical protein